jgi:hypothetical protein
MVYGGLREQNNCRLLYEQQLPALNLNTVSCTLDIIYVQYAP